MFSKGKANNVHEMIMSEIKDVESCLIHFESFMHAATTPETVYETLMSLAEVVRQAEDTADKSLRRMIDSLNGNFLPSTREQIIEIASSCDRIANKGEKVANMVICQDFRFPAEFAEDLKKIMSITRSQFDVLKTSISRLFSDMGGLLKDHSILDEIRSLETDVDKIEMGIYKRIFHMDVELAKKMQITQFVELVCDISDVTENIADKIQIMLITRKA